MKVSSTFIPNTQISAYEGWELNCTDGILLTSRIIVLLNEILGHAVILPPGLEESQLGAIFLHSALDVKLLPRP